MGSSKASKQESHERIVQTAAARMRESGIEGVGVADLMQEAGLTHGGFYRHFASREDLVGEAVERALEDGGRAAAALKLSKKPPQAVLKQLIDGYLSAAHRDALASSCAVTTLAGDVARSTDRARSAYTAQVESYLDLLVTLIGSEAHGRKRTQALAALATLVGAVSMARAVKDEKLSLEILKAAGDELKARLA